MFKKRAETYRIAPSVSGEGIFFITDCGNQMYSAGNDHMRYHGKLCPKCFLENKYVTLYIRGSEEANKIMDERLRQY